MSHQGGDTRPEKANEGPTKLGVEAARRDYTPAPPAKNEKGKPPTTRERGATTGAGANTEQSKGGAASRTGTEGENTGTAARTSKSKAESGDTQRTAAKGEKAEQTKATCLLAAEASTAETQTTKQLGDEGDPRSRRLRQGRGLRAQREPARLEDESWATRPSSPRPAREGAEKTKSPKTSQKQAESGPESAKCEKRVLCAGTGSSPPSPQQGSEEQEAPRERPKERRLQRPAQEAPTEAQPQMGLLPLAPETQEEAREGEEDHPARPWRLPAEGLEAQVQPQSRADSRRTPREEALASADSRWTPRGEAQTLGDPLGLREEAQTRADSRRTPREEALATADPQTSRGEALESADSREGPREEAQVQLKEQEEGLLALLQAAREFREAEGPLPQAPAPFPLPQPEPPLRTEGPEPKECLLLQAARGTPTNWTTRRQRRCPERSTGETTKSSSRGKKAPRVSSPALQAEHTSTEEEGVQEGTKAEGHGEVGGNETHRSCYSPSREGPQRGRPQSGPSLLSPSTREPLLELGAGPHELQDTAGDRGSQACRGRWCPGRERCLRREVQGCTLPERQLMEGEPGQRPRGSSQREGSWEGPCVSGTPLRQGGLSSKRSPPPPQQSQDWEQDENERRPTKLETAATRPCPLQASSAVPAVPAVEPLLQAEKSWKSLPRPAQPTPTPASLVPRGPPEEAPSRAKLTPWLQQKGAHEERLGGRQSRADGWQAQGRKRDKDPAPRNHAETGPSRQLLPRDAASQESPQPDASPQVEWGCARLLPRQDKWQGRGEGTYCPAAHKHTHRESDVQVDGGEDTVRAVEGEGCLCQPRRASSGWLQETTARTVNPPSTEEIRTGRRARDRQWGAENPTADQGESTLPRKGTAEEQSRTPCRTVRNVPAWGTASTPSGIPPAPPRPRSPLASWRSGLAPNAAGPESSPSGQESSRRVPEEALQVSGGPPQWDLVPQEGGTAEPAIQQHIQTSRQLQGNGRKWRWCQGCRAMDRMGRFWWRDVSMYGSNMNIGAGELRGVQLTIFGRRIFALIDSGATHSFLTPEIVDVFQLKTTPVPKPVVLMMGNKTQTVVSTQVQDLYLRVGRFGFVGSFLVAPVPFDVVLGLDWLQHLKATTDWGKNRLTLKAGTYLFRTDLEKLKILRKERNGVIDPELSADRRTARAAHDELLAGVGEMGPRAADLVRPQAKKYKNFRNRNKRIPIKQLIEDAKNSRGVEFGEIELAYAVEPLERGHPPDRDDQNTDSELGTSGAEALESYLTAQESRPSYNKVNEWLEEGQNLRNNEDLVRTIRKYKALFVDEVPGGLPPPRVIDHTIPLVPEAQIARAGAPRATKDEIDAMRTQLQQLLQKGWITRTSSPFAAPAMMVPKKGDPPGSPGSRMVINYRALNAITIAAEFPLPVIEDILQLLQGAKVFTIMDMEQGFHQVRMNPQDRYKTAFRTFMGQFEWVVMPFGLKGAPSTFQAIMNHMFFDLIGQGVIVYIDDLLVYAKTMEEHIKILDEVLRRLSVNKMFPKFSKCRFAVKEIEYLGHTVGEHGVRPSEEKIEAIKVWPSTLANETQVRQFLGTVNYCRQYMGPEFAALARPLNDLLRNGKEFVWQDVHTKAVEELKNRLIHYTLLALPDQKKPFVLRTDASGFAIGAVLEQDGKPLGFYSKALTGSELRYATYDQELLAVIAALQRWQPLLTYAQVTVYTDHQALQFITKLRKDQPTSGRLARYLDFLASFQDLKIVYKPGATNVVADALSRCPAYIPLEARNGTQKKKMKSSEMKPPPMGSRTVRVNSSNVTVRLTEEDGQLTLLIGRTAVDDTACLCTLAAEEPPSRRRRTQEETAEAQPTSAEPQQDPLVMAGIGDEVWEEALSRCSEFGEAYRVAKSQEGEPVYVENHGCFKFGNRLLLTRIHGLWRVCVPNFPSFKQRILYQHHDLPTSGHLGTNKTYASLSRIYYWKGIKAYTQLYVETCVKCKASKALSQRTAGLLQCLRLPSRRWSNISMDFITDLPKTQDGKDGILSVVDYLSKMAHFIPLSMKASAADVVELFADRVVRYHGFPQRIVTDRDPRFTSAMWEAFCAKFGIKNARSTAFHPQTDGQTERVNRTIEQMLRTYIQSQQDEWPRLLPALELAYNCASHSSTGLSPFEIMIGENPLRAHDLELTETVTYELTPPMTKAFQMLVDRASAHIEHAQQLQKAYADSKRRPEEFAVGDKVWLSTRYLNYSGCPKFRHRYVGPFQVTKRIGKVAYELKLPDSMNIHNVFHVSLLTRDQPRPEHMRPPGGEDKWGPVISVDNDEYEVEFILDERGSGSSKQYLVEWKGYSEDDASWVPERNLANAQEVLRDFKSNRTRRARQAKRRRTTQPLDGQDGAAQGALQLLFSPQGGERERDGTSHTQA